MKRRILALLLVLTMLLSIVPTVFAEEAPTSGTCGENVTWTFDDAGTLTISGTGTMYNYSGSWDIPWLDIREDIQTIVMEEGLASIGDFAFARCSNLTSVTIPDSVTLIGNYAFGMCISLTSVAIPDSVTSIGSWAFLSCSGLTSFTIPNSVTSIGDTAFQSCTSLTGITIPASVTSIGTYAFSYCTCLTEIEFKGNTPEIGEDCFYDVTANAYYPAENATWTADVMQNYGGSITWLSNAPDSDILYSGTYGDNLEWTLTDDGVLTIFGTGRMIDSDGAEATPWVFLPQEIQTIYIADGVTSIGDFAFEAYGPLTSLTSVTIPDSITSIGGNAFSWCENLASITIPYSVTSIGGNAFSWCASLSEIVFEGDAPELGESCFYSVTATAYYPKENDSWTEDVMQNYGGTITWVPYSTDLEPTEPTEPTPTEPTPTEPTSTEPTPTEPKPTEPVPTEPKPTEPTPTESKPTTPTPTEPTPTEPKPTEPTPTEPEPTVPAVVFEDVSEDQWFYDTVQWAVTKGITTGTTATTFEPDETCTRNQVVTFLWRAAGKPEPTSTTNPFKDVKESDYFYKAVLWAVENGITTGTSATTFAPEEPCTRGQVVTFLHRAAGNPAVSNEKNPFSDVGDAYYTEPVLWAVENGITTGVTNTTFEPESTCTRAQIVTFLYRNEN